MEKKLIRNTVLFGKPEEVNSLPLKSIIPTDESDERLTGLILRGYETKFNGERNENFEVFAPGCLDKFINEYFVKNKLNMPVDIQHINDMFHLCGRVLLIEVNDDGFYFIVYVPKLYRQYDYLKDFLLKEKIIQGFSKCGWATDYENVFENNEFSYMLIKEMEITRLSLVDSPANGNPFEKVEVTNATKYVNNLKEQPKKKIFRT